MVATPQCRLYFHAMSTRQRQRSIITPEHFVVAPEILGMPLASPSRRAFAMLIDLLLVVLLAKAGGVFLGVAAAILLLRASKPDARTGFIKTSVRAGLRVAGALLLFLVITKAWHRIGDRVEKKAAPATDANVVSTGDLNLNLTAGQLASLGGPLMKLRHARDTSDVKSAARVLLQTAKDAGASADDIGETRSGLIDLMGDSADSAKIAALDHVIGEYSDQDEPAALTTDSLLRKYVALLDKHDTLAAHAYHDTIKDLIAGSDIARLNDRANKLDQRGDSLQKELDAAHKTRGFRSAIAGFAVDDLGIGFGWSALYFTAFLALWRGKTPGKRVAGIRVLRLDGEPLGWWMSFERFGGYAASFSVGLLGFAQILWDRNRQSLHDKACETVVVRELKN